MCSIHWQFLIIYIFSVSLKSGACYITGQWDDFRVNNAIVYLQRHFWHFFVFHQKYCFYHFHFSFMNINQSKTEYQPIKNRNWWLEIVSGTAWIQEIMVCLTKEVYVRLELSWSNYSNFSSAAAVCRYSSK